MLVNHQPWSVSQYAEFILSTQYGAYDFTNGQCLHWHQENCNSETTVAFLHQLAQQWPHLPNQQTTIIWDGASWHGRVDIVRAAAKTLGFFLIQLPVYSPDLNPIEGLWKWLREELTQHHSYKYLYQLERACFDFIDRINLDPEAIISRLWPKFDLEYEKVIFSVSVRDMLQSRKCLKSIVGPDRWQKSPRNRFFKLRHVVDQSIQKVIFSP